MLRFWSQTNRELRCRLKPELISFKVRLIDKVFTRPTKTLYKWLTEPTGGHGSGNESLDLGGAGGVTIVLAPRPKHKTSTSVKVAVL